MKDRPVNYWVSVTDAKIELTVGNWPPNGSIGQFTMDVDGFYYFWPKRWMTGCFTGWLLIALGKELGKLNKTWGDRIDKESRKKKR